MKQVALLAALALAFVAGCGGDDDEGAAPTTTAMEECAKEDLALVNPGQLTIGTDNPAFPPWFDGGSPEGSQWELNDPATGEGFESAVAYAVAEQLGFAENEVEWVVVPFNQSFRPGQKSFDFDINQISYSEERDRAVDFSDSYYDVNQSLVALKGTAIANAKSQDELKPHQLGAQIGTTSLAYIQDNLEPDKEPRVYDTNNDAISALKAKQIDGIVVDLPTAFFITAAQIENSVIVGQFPAEGEQERFGMVFEDGSTLVNCVNKALEELKDDGSLEQIQQEWLSDKASAPVLE